MCYIEYIYPFHTKQFAKEGIDPFSEYSRPRGASKHPLEPFNIPKVNILAEIRVVGLGSKSRLMSPLQLKLILDQAGESIE